MRYCKHLINRTLFAYIYLNLNEIKMYTHKDAIQLAKYYHDKVIGQPLDKKKSTKILITETSIEELENGTFRVTCKGSATPSIVLYKDIYSIAEDFGLPLPKEVLSHKAD